MTYNSIWNTSWSHMITIIWRNQMPSNQIICCSEVGQNHHHWNIAILLQFSCGNHQRRWRHRRHRRAPRNNCRRCDWLRNRSRRFVSWAESENEQFNEFTIPFLLKFEAHRSQLRVHDANVDLMIHQCSNDKMDLILQSHQSNSQHHQCWNGPVL